jgi:hypothetical protein
MALMAMITVVAVGRSRGWPWWVVALLALMVGPAIVLIVAHIAGRAAVHELGVQQGVVPVRLRNRAAESLVPPPGSMSLPRRASINRIDSCAMSIARQ